MVDGCQPSCGMPTVCGSATPRVGYCELENYNWEAECRLSEASSCYYEEAFFFNDPKFSISKNIVSKLFSKPSGSQNIGSDQSLYSLTVFTKADDDLLLAGMPWWFYIVQGGLLLLAKFIPPVEVLGKKLDAIPFINRKLMAYTYKHDFFVLDDTHDFYEGVLKCQEMGYDENEALKMTFRYLLLNKERLDSLDIPSESYFTLKILKDLEIAGFKPLQIQRMTQFVEDEVMKKFPATVFEPIAILNREISSQTIDKSLRDTGEILKKDVLKRNFEWESVKEILGVILKKVRLMKDAPNGDISVRVGPYTIMINRSPGAEKSGVISLPILSASKQDLISTIESVINKLDKGESLNAVEKKLVEEIKSNPLVERVINIYKKTRGEVDEGILLWARLLEEAKKLEGTLLRKALWEISNYPGVSVGLSFPDGRHLQVTWKSVLKDTQVVLEAPYYMGPYSFTRGLQVAVKEFGVKKLPAVFGRDRDGNMIVRDLDDLTKLGEIEAFFKDSKSYKGTEIKKSFFQFYNDVLVVWKAVYGNEFKFPPDTPRSVHNRAKLFRKVNWGIRLEQEIELSVVEFKRASFKDENSFSERLSEKFGQIEMDFEGYFLDSNKDCFKSALQTLREAILKGEREVVNGSRSTLSSIIEEEIGLSSSKLKGMSDIELFKGGPRSFEFLNEWKAWSGITVEQLKTGDVSREIIEAVEARRLAEERPPISVAEACVKDQSYTKAFKIYDSIIWNPAMGDTGRMSALAGMINLAVKRYDFFRIEMGLKELEKMVLKGCKLSVDAKNLVARLVSYETPLFPVYVPYALKKKVIPIVNQNKKLTPVDPNGLNGLSFNWQGIIARLNLMPEAIQENIQVEIMEARSRDLFGLKPEFLKLIALCNESELHDLLKLIYPGEEYFFRLSQIIPFHDKMSGIVSAALSGGDKVVTKDVLPLEKYVNPGMLNPDKLLSLDKLYGGSSDFSKIGANVVNPKNLVLESVGIKTEKIKPIKNFSRLRNALNAVEKACKFAREKVRRFY